MPPGRINTFYRGDVSGRTDASARTKASGRTDASARTKASGWTKTSGRTKAFVWTDVSARTEKKLHYKKKNDQKEADEFETKKISLNSHGTHSIRVDACRLRKSHIGR
jgi:hypothetical protein